MTVRVWRLPFLIERWVDGDTVMGEIDFGWGFMWMPPKGLRLLLADGSTYDAPERRKPTTEQGMAAADAARALAPSGTWVMITSHYVDPDDFGRPLCSIELDDGADLAGALVMLGHVKRAP